MKTVIRRVSHSGAEIHSIELFVPTLETQKSLSPLFLKNLIYCFYTMEATLFCSDNGQRSRGK